MPVNEEIIQNEDLSIYPEKILTLAKNLRHFGRMNDPISSALIKGPCGDEMEFYLVIENRIIKEVKFYTEGCISTLVCGEIAAQQAEGKSIEQALAISPKQVIDLLGNLPQDHCHCTILAVSTLYRAIADYLLKYEST